MTILTRNKTQNCRYATLSKFELDRCYRLARVQLSKELPFKITDSYARSLYSPSLEDVEYINNLKTLQDIFYTKLKNKCNYLNNKESTFLCINLGTNYDEKGDETDESETTNSDYDTSTTFSNYSYSTINTFTDHDIDWIRSSLDEYDDDNDEFWGHLRRLFLFNIIVPFIFIIFMILFKFFFDFDN
ncbi:hypothetical protein RclHR1_00160007 [Rhizophagus clarus]|uniref:Uncharacterized protein n=1 Tax=Rhizophagus clarus TaxID=94130 RepID=A0A2Z6QX39_9GLOM|nr:hypothetical protein RclHR1_00160007 [Rhizophagus clarus]GES81115.1 hypothetical protein GLOIN_2v1780387 [Rhizophagus clarus]